MKKGPKVAELRKCLTNKSSREIQAKVQLEAVWTGTKTQAKAFGEAFGSPATLMR